MKYFISKIIPHRDRCWEAVTFKNKEINTCLQEGWKDYFFFFSLHGLGGRREEEQVAGRGSGRGCSRT